MTTEPVLDSREHLANVEKALTKLATDDALPTSASCWDEICAIVGIPGRAMTAEGMEPIVRAIYKLKDDESKRAFSEAIRKTGLPDGERDEFQRLKECIGGGTTQECIDRTRTWGEERGKLHRENKRLIEALAYGDKVNAEKTQRLSDALLAADQARDAAAVHERYAKLLARLIVKTAKPTKKTKKAKAQR